MFDFKGNVENISSVSDQKKTACFGKLPIINEFIKININTKELIDFEGWLKDGILHMARTSYVSIYGVKKIFQPHMFIVHDDDLNSIILGCIKNSSDLSGREYPFITVSSHNNYLDKIELTPFVYRDYINQQKEILKSSFEFKSEEQICDILNYIDEDKPDLSINNEVSYINRKLEKMDMSDLCEKLFPRLNSNEVVKMFSFLKMILKSIARRTVQRTNWGLMLPIVSSDEHYFVVFWLMLINSFKEIGCYSRVYYWSFEEQPTLKMFFSPIQPSYLGGVLYSGNSTNILVDVMSESKSQEIDKSIVISDISVLEFCKIFSNSELFKEEKYDA